MDDSLPVPAAAPASPGPILTPSAARILAAHAAPPAAVIAAGLKGVNPALDALFAETCRAAMARPAAGARAPGGGVPDRWSRFRSPVPAATAPALGCRAESRSWLSPAIRDPL